MEKLMTIKQAFGLTERNYTDRNGIPALFSSRGFILSDGIHYWLYIPHSDAGMRKGVEGQRRSDTLFQRCPHRKDRLTQY